MDTISQMYQVSAAHWTVDGKDKVDDIYLAEYIQVQPGYSQSK